MKTIEVIWFNNARGSIGVVLAENDIEQRAYMAGVYGHDEEEDIEIVKKWGSKLSISQAKGFFSTKVDEERYAKN
ncbi:MAG: hypothetical protein AABY15_02750 [Nanoarchaeota archaeon]